MCDGSVYTVRWGESRRLGFAFATGVFLWLQWSGNVARLISEENAMLCPRREGTPKEVFPASKAILEWVLGL